MGRRSKSRSLVVWMNGERVGEWRLPATGAQEFAYADNWLTSPNARPLSLSMPLRPSELPYRSEVPAYFENLLPDNADIRARMQRRFQTQSAEAFDLLAEAGRDCVGAIQLMRAEEAPPSVRRIVARRVDESEIERLLSGTLGPAWEIEDEDSFRISLAGAQEKTALLWHEHAWHVPHGTTPTTHILKLPIGKAQQGLDLSTSVENEWLCAQLVAAYGFPVASCRIANFGQFKTLIVERFDRKLAEEGSWWLRLPQEDFCQATSTPPALKYENDGGPGIHRIMDLLMGSERAEEDRRDFLRTQVLFWMLAAIDGHAKNFSLFLLPGSGYRLTPRYDILSAHPLLGRRHGQLPVKKIRMAMAVDGKNRHYHWTDIRLRHWLETARRCGVPRMGQIIEELVEQTPSVISTINNLLPPDFPQELASRILDGTAAAARELGDELARTQNAAKP